MPKYDVTAPDGSIYSVNAPEGATEDDAIKYVQTNFGKPSAPAAPLTKGERFGQGLKDPISGGAQLLTKMLPDSVVNAGNQLNNFMADKTGLVGRLPEGGVDQQVREQEAEYQRRRAASEPQSISSLVTGQRTQPGIDWARMAGNVLSPANLAIASRTPQAAGLLGKIGVGAASGAASGALSPVVNGDNFAMEKATQMGMGAGFGGAVPAVLGGLGRIVSPNASTNPNVQLLKAEGVTPTIGQAAGGRMNAVEEKLMSVPILGDAIAGARGRAQDQFNQAAINRAVTPIGGRATGTGQDAVREAGDALSKAYDTALNQVKVVRFDQQFGQEARQLSQMSQSLQPNMRNRFNETMQEVIGGKLSGNGSMLGTTYKQIDSKLGQEAARFGKSQDPFAQELGDAYKQLQSLLKDQMMRSNPQVAKALNQADEGWANLVRVEGAAGAAKNAEGLFTPAQLNAAIKGADKSVRGRAVGRGTALMQDLGNAGQQVLGNKVPNSGTTDRLLMGALAGGGAYAIEPSILAGLLGTSAMYTKPMQGLLSGAMTNRPESAQAIAELLRKSSPGLVPMGAQLGLGLMN